MLIVDEKQIDQWFVSFVVGTPAQSLSLIIDTGSSDIWVNVPTSKFCQTGHCLTGTYDPKSRSKRIVNNNFGMIYGDGQGASGQFVTDSIYFDHKTVSNVQFGLAFFSEKDPGTFGIGYSANQARAPNSNSNEYPSFADRLIDNGIIRINAFSMWLDVESRGTVLFGGVDKTKYLDELKTVPILLDGGKGVELQIGLHGLSISRENSVITAHHQNQNPNSNPISALLDSGSTSMILPAAFVKLILTTLESIDVPNYWPLVDCSIVESGMTLDFTFDSSTVIQIPMRGVLEEWGGYIQPGTSKKLCSLHLEVAVDNLAILGTPFLRNTYVVYNLQDNEISLALIKHGVTDSDVVEIGSSVSRSDDRSKNIVSLAGDLMDGRTVSSIDFTQDGKSEVSDDLELKTGAPIAS